MIRDRIVGYVIVARGALTWAWPFILALAVAGLLAVLPLLVLTQAQVLREVKEATEINRRLIERGLPCAVEDDPNSEACVTQAERDRRLAEALAAVQEQHDTESQHLDDVVDRLIELQSRQHGFSPEPLPSPEVTVPPARVTPTTRPRTTTTTVRRVPGTTTVAPTTTTTVCQPPDCKPNKP